MVWLRLRSATVYENYFYALLFYFLNAKVLLFDYFFVNPNEKVKEQMKKKEYYAKVIGVFICAKSETVRTSISKINNGHYDHSDISDRSIEILENNGITFYHT